MQWGICWVCKEPLTALDNPISKFIPAGGLPPELQKIGAKAASENVWMHRPCYQNRKAEIQARENLDAKAT